MWDNENPAWLGSSIYEYLQNDGNYQNFVKLIDDLDYAEVLGKTGSKTLFVADDEAFNKFYQSNSWGVKNYGELTLAQKKLLLNSAMINNAYLLEMMSSTAAGGGDNDEPEKGQCLRRETAADVTDSVPHFLAKDLPVSYNTTEKDYWGRFRNDKGIYIALDATSPMMTHFLSTQLAAQKITDNDFKIITGYDRSKNDAFIFNAKIIKQDITCQNGYINVLDKVLVPPQNMAEVLRTGKNTQIFSHMIDRFSAPFYNSTLTDRYRLVYGNSVDSVYQKRYFADRSQGNTALYNDANTDPINNPTGNVVFDANSNKPLPFDPGWNQYRTDAQTQKEQDMAAIFCPTDSMLMQYFFAKDGGGRFLVKAYAPDLVEQIKENTNDIDLVYQAIDQIPRNTIRALLNNLMKESFNGCVPSKFATIKNSAQDAMFDEKDNYHVDRIIETKLASNGIIYLMNEVTTPAEYAAVSAPAYVETNKRIFNWAIQSAKLGNIPSNYYAYLLAMSSRFSFFVPCDDDFWYIDPLSFYSPTVQSGDQPILVGRAYNYIWDEKNSRPKVASYEYKYDISTGTGTIGDLRSTENVSENTFGNRLKDMLETHTIIHEDNTEITGIDETETGVECNKQYFISKNGAVISAENSTARENGMVVRGGWQIGTDNYSKVTGFDDKTAKKNGYGNGFAYMIDKPMQPTIESAYSAMYYNPNFSTFFELCQTDVSVLQEIGITSTAEQGRYNIFVDNKGLPCFDKTTGKIVQSATNVRFFNNYRYTIYIPTNEAMQAAFNAGLPSWQDVRDFLQLDLDDDDPEKIVYDTTKEEDAAALEARNIKAKAMVTSIVNFVKNHFVDNSVFVDRCVMQPTQYETQTINSETGVYCKVKVSSDGSNSLTVADATGKVCTTTSDYDIMARDYITNGSTTAINATITSSSSVVLHGINGVLDYKKYDGGRYDSDWASSAKARAYLNKYKLMK